MSSQVVHVAGARPNFPKLAPVHHALAEVGISQTLIHTGQHYDDRLSDSFFADLELPQPDLNLGVGSGTHANQTAAVMVGLEGYLSSERPEVLVVYGDVNSTLAGALVAAKLQIPVAHVEAGLRSGDMSMPEEINRRLTDQLSDLLFATSADAVENLNSEGLSGREIHMVGNTMIDTLMKVKPKLRPTSVLARLNVTTPYLVATLHRPSNVDDEDSAAQAVALLKLAADQLPVVLPLHPRGKATLQKAGIGNIENLSVVEPLGYLDFISLVSGAKAVITDSGGIQEETTVLGVACLTMRDTTERPVTISHGTNRLVNASNFESNLALALSSDDLPSSIPNLWDGHSGPRIANILRDWLRKS